MKYDFSQKYEKWFDQVKKLLAEHDIQKPFFRSYYLNNDLPLTAVRKYMEEFYGKKGRNELIKQENERLKRSKE